MRATPVECLDSGRCSTPGACQTRELCSFTANGAALVSKRRYARGDRIAAGTVSDGRMHFHVVRTGLAAASATLPDGRRQLTCLFAPGEVICPFGVGEADCCAEALTTTETWEVALTGNRGLMRNDASLAGAFFDLCHRALERSLSHSIVLGRFNGPERLSLFIADMTRRSGLKSRDFWDLALPMSRDDIADYLGLNPETVSRLFTQLKKKGLIRMPCPTRLEIPDLDRLEMMAPLRPTTLAAPIPFDAAAVAH